MKIWSWPVTIFSRVTLRMLGWKLKRPGRDFPRRGVAIAGPHTSHWDLAISLLAFWASRVPFRIAVKKEVFEVPLLGTLIRWLGGIPIDRSSSQGYTTQLAQALRDSEPFVLCISPPGTRSQGNYWRTGFHAIARKADVPIILGYMDWAKKEAGLGKVFMPTDLDQDFAEIRRFYADKPAKFPWKITPIRHKGEVQL